MGPLPNCLDNESRVCREVYFHHTMIKSCNSLLNYNILQSYSKVSINPQKSQLQSCFFYALNQLKMWSSTLYFSYLINFLIFFIALNISNFKIFPLYFVCEEKSKHLEKISSTLSHGNWDHGKKGEGSVKQELSYVFAEKWWNKS